MVKSVQMKIVASCTFKLMRSEIFNVLHMQWVTLWFVISRVVRVRVSFRETVRNFRAVLIFAVSEFITAR